jgi:CHAT domain-containing protein
MKEIESNQEMGRDVLNVAQALREAVSAVKNEKKDPYSWPSFVLYGAGFYKFR